MIDRPIQSGIIRIILHALFVLLILSFIVYLAILTEIAIAIAVLSIFIATFFSRRSLIMATKSLELTRASIRPFLYMQSDRTLITLTKHDMRFEFFLKNDGVLPGEIISINIFFFGQAEVVTQDNESKTYPIRFEPSSVPMILFPGNSTTVGLSIECNSDERKRLADDIGKYNVVIRHRVLYKCNNLNYITLQTGLLRKQSPNTWVISHTTPQHWT